MKFEHIVVIEAPKDKVRAFLDDVPRAAKCVPGVEDVTSLGNDAYEGRLKMRVGPLGFTLAGKATVQRSEDADSWRLEGEGRDGRIGAGAKALLQAHLSEDPPGVTSVAVSADINFSGRLAELGQPLIKRKADAIVLEFAENLRRAVTEI